jgi:hypothetical protein
MCVLVFLCCEEVATFKYLGTTLTNQNDIRDEIKSRLNSGNDCYYSVQNHLSSHLISKNIEIKIYKTVILPVVLYGCETWLKHRLTVFENRALRRIFGPKKEEVGLWRKSSPNIVRVLKSRSMRWAGHVARMGEGRGVYRVFWLRGPKARDHWEDLCVSERITLRWTLGR